MEDLANVNELKRAAEPFAEDEKIGVQGIVRRNPNITTTDSQIWCLILRIRPRASHRGTLMPVRFRPKLVAKITLSDKPSL